MRKPAIWKLSLRVLRGALIVYFALLAMLGLLQRKLIYFPTRVAEARLVDVALGFGLEPWRTARGEFIGWRQRAASGEQPRNRLVVFHGNAGMALDRDYFIRGFAPLDDRRTWQVFLFEYPGYGARPGAPSEAEFRRAGREAIAALQAEDARPIFLAGESLGCGLACALAGESPEKIAGLFLLTPFASLGDVAALHYPWLPVRLVLRDRWDNVAAVRHFSGPLAVFVAGADEIVTAAQGRKLFDSYAGKKRLWLDAESTHNMIPNSPAEPWWREVSDFLRDAPARLSAP